MRQAPILSIDWLQLNVSAPKTIAVVYHSFFTVKVLPYSTRHFKLVEEIYRHGSRIATITRVPLSNILPADTILIKFDNWVLYSFELFTYVTEFLALNNFTFKSISRLDVCADFQRFDNNMLPSNFIRNYLYGYYLRLGRTTASNAHFKQIKNDLSFNALKFGSNLSDISTYLYNKTLEMNSVKWKPWIATVWYNAGFDMNKDTWRLEVSIKDCNKLIVNQDTSECSVINNLTILQRPFTRLLYGSLRDKYFSFVIKDEQVKKSRMTKLPLFSDSFAKYAVVAGQSMISATRADKIFIKKLEDVNNDLRGKNFNFNVDIASLKEQYIEVTGLHSWAIFKGLL